MPLLFNIYRKVILARTKKIRNKHPNHFKISKAMQFADVMMGVWITKL